MAKAFIPTHTATVIVEGCGRRSGWTDDGTKVAIPVRVTAKRITSLHAVFDRTTGRQINSPMISSRLHIDLSTLKPMSDATIATGSSDAPASIPAHVVCEDDPQRDALPDGAKIWLRKAIKLIMSDGGFGEGMAILCGMADMDYPAETQTRSVRWIDARELIGQGPREFQAPKRHRAK